MSVTHDYECAAHGVFESKTGKCPYGCSKRFVQRVFLQAPAFKSTRTKRADRELNLLAKSYNMTDIRNGRDGESVMQTQGRGHFGSSDDPRSSTWIDVPHAQPGFSRTPGAKVPVVDVRSFGGDGAGAVDLAKSFKVPDPKRVTAIRKSRE
jgi:hypothetical protein